MTLRDSAKSRPTSPVPPALILTILLIAGCTRSSPHQSSVAPATADVRVWYVGDGEIGVGQTRLFLFNPANGPARVSLHVYLEHSEPQTITREVPPGEVAESDLSELEALPRGSAFWLVAESDTAILPQLRESYFAADDPVPDALLSVAPYRGPLSTETTWIYPDCFVGGAEHWFEKETITILNPSGEPVTVRLTYVRGGQAAVEELQIAARRMLALDAGSRHPRLDGGRGDPIGIGGDYALRIDASAPVVTQMTRRARLLGESQVIGARSAIGFPLPNPPPRVWHYPGGYDARSARGGAEPWNLLFVLNLDSAAPVKAELVFHGSKGRRSTYPDIAIPPSTADLRWLHHWLGEYVTREPWAVTVRGSGPVVAALTSAEFETRDDFGPEAMTAVVLCAEPLAGHQSQWLGIGPVGTSDDGVLWHQNYALFNPGGEPANVTLSFEGLGGKTKELALVIPNAAVARVDAAEIEDLPSGEPLAVRADANQPLCVQTVVRTSAQEPSYTRAMYSFLGVPVSTGRSP